MRRNREKFDCVVNRVKDLKRCYARQVEAAAKGAADPAVRRVPRVAVAAVVEGAWVCEVAGRKAKSNGHKLTKDEQAALDRARAFFAGILAGDEETVAAGGFLAELDALFVVHLEAACLLVLKMDAEEKARKAQAVVAAGISSADDGDEDEDTGDGETD
jgi:hypothetical protein